MKLFLGKWVYRIFFFLCVCFALPKLFYDFLIKKKYRGSLKYRLGFNLPQFDIESKKGPVIWFHAVSVGESKSIIKIIHRVQAAFPEAYIAVSSTTETGFHTIEKACPEIDSHFYIPLDFPWIMNSIARRLKPNLLVIAESDLWFEMLLATKKAGATITIVNGKISDRSFRRYSQLRLAVGLILNLVDKWYVQGEIHHTRLVDLGIPAENIEVTGNLKLDLDSHPFSEKECTAFRTRLGILQGTPVLCIGSTHSKEEALLLNSVEKVWKKFPELLVLLVPRHPERFNEVAQLLKKRGIPFSRFSEMDSTPQVHKVILIDTMGILKQCYQISSIAIVGGSFVPIGGHNIMEPAEYGIPVLYGPYMHAQPDLLAAMKEHGAQGQIKPSTLHTSILNLLENPSLRELEGKKGQKAFVSQRGATESTFSSLSKIIQNSV